MRLIEAHGEVVADAFQGEDVVGSGCEMGGVFAQANSIEQDISKICL